jgi:hypothetical protein
VRPAHRKGKLCLLSLFCDGNRFVTPRRPFRLRRAFLGLRDFGAS